MVLRLPSEIVVDRFLPTVRVLLATALDDRGFTQREVADRLGVSQGAVSQYLRGDAAVEPLFADHPRTVEVVETIADGFAAGTMDDYEALAELLGLVREFEDRGPICELHEEVVPALEGLGCDLCVRGLDSATVAERDVLRDVRRAARTLASSGAFVPLVPNVGTNVGMALPDPEDEVDVAAVPGRLHARQGRLTVPTSPEFGGSQHVARTLLAAAAVDPETRGALNIVTDDAVLESARERGIAPLEVDAEYEDRTDRLTAAFEDRGSVPRVVYHRGAFGIEPITYVLGPTATAAADLALDLIADGRGALFRTGGGPGSTLRTRDSRQSGE